MSVQLGWETLVSTALISALIFWLGAISEYLWHSLRHRS